MSDVKLVLLQDGAQVAAVYAPSHEAAWNEMAHYILQYEQDGPVKVKARNRVIYDTEYVMPEPSPTDRRTAPADARSDNEEQSSRGIDKENSK